MTTKPIHLEVNHSGGWRRVMTFDAQHDVDRDAVLQAAGKMLRWADNPRLKARIIMPGDTAPLMTWKPATGWREWRHPADRLLAQGELA